MHYIKFVKLTFRYSQASNKLDESIVIPRSELKKVLEKFISKNGVLAIGSFKIDLNMVERIELYYYEEQAVL